MADPRQNNPGGSPSGGFNQATGPSASGGFNQATGPSPSGGFNQATGPSASGGYPPQAHPQSYGGPAAPYPSGPMPAAYPGQPAPYPQGPMASHVPMPSHVPQQQQQAPYPSTAPAPAAGPAVIELSQIRKDYTRGSESVTVLNGLTLTVNEGAFVALMGPSGSGKSTLLNIIAGLDQPTAGVARIAGQNLESMSAADLTRFRSRYIGFIFQQYNLIPILNARENVELPMTLYKISAAERRRRAETVLRIVGLEQRMTHYPRQLSGGQEQRVAIARALVNDPAILVADEPTGDLDRQSADDILNVLTTLNRELRKTIVMVTHDPAAAQRASVTRHLDKGVLRLG